MGHEHTHPPGQKIQEPDRTAEAVRRQLTGMAVPVYDIGVRIPDGRMLPATMQPDDVDTYLPWLKFQNRQGSDVYIRPQGSMGIVLIDDLHCSQVNRMQEDGVSPSVVTETSPHNFQAWVRLSRDPIPPPIATEAARLLASAYEADPRAADYRHYGRLAGFTNRKQEYRRADGRYPFVRVVYSTPIVAPNGAAYLDEAARQLEHYDQLPTDPAVFSASREAVCSLAAAFQAEVAIRHKLYPGEQDYSRMDWMIVKQLAMTHPTATPAELMEALRLSSPNLDKRKAGHIEDYIRRTVYKVLHDPTIKKMRQDNQKN